MLKFLTSSAEETIRLGRYIGRLAVPSSVIALSGNLGSGKTTLVKGIAAGMGIDADRVNSPSFVLIREYRGKKGKLVHADVYRLDNAGQITFLGLEEYFNSAVVVIEWAKKARHLLPEDHVAISIAFSGKDHRRFTVSAQGRRSSAIVARLRAATAQPKSGFYREKDIHA